MVDQPRQHELADDHDADPVVDDDNHLDVASDVEDDADEETTLDALAAAYAGLTGGGATSAAAANPLPADQPETSPDDPTAERDEPQAAKVEEVVSPLGILEAVLFVGNAENSPLTAKRIAALMRGVSPREVDAMVVKLNDEYCEVDAPYEVVSNGAGYLLAIRDEYAGLRDRFYGNVREARLSQAAIDILAVIAYGQPMTREEIDETRGKPAGALLSQLVRRQLLRIERPDEKPRRPKYYTTKRFLKIMGLEDITELPESQEFDKSF